MNNWLRLWHELPTDPKFKVVSKTSSQPIPLVIAIYIVLLVDASQNVTERGVTQCDAEIISCVLDVEINDVKSVLNAMQGRLLDGNIIKGWNKRQPKKEDNSSERTRTYREKLKEDNRNNEDVTIPPASHCVTERNVTLDKIKIRDKSISNLILINKKIDKIDKDKICPFQEIVDCYNVTCPELDHVFSITEKRKAAMLKLWEKYNMKKIHIFEDCFLEAAKSDFLNGKVLDKNGKKFVANFDWLMNEKNFEKTIEGFYKTTHKK